MAENDLGQNESPAEHKPKLFCEEHFLNEGYLATLKNNASL